MPEIPRKSRARFVPFELSLVGGSDGVPVELAGRGRFDSKSRQLSLEVEVAHSILLFDLALVSISLLDVLALAALAPRPTPESDAGTPVYVRSRTDIYDENGREAGGWRVVATLERARGGLRFDGQLLDCQLLIEPGERVVAADVPRIAIAQPLEPEGLMVAGASCASTGRGNCYHGVTSSVIHDWSSPRTVTDAVRIGFEGIEVRRIRKATAGEVVGLKASITTGSLA